MHFDGVSFTAFTTDNTSGMAGDDISFNILWEDSTGVLWAGTYGRGVFRNDHGHFSSFGTMGGGPGETIYRVDGDSLGNVWVFSIRGVMRWADGRMQPEHPEQGGPPLVPHDERRTVDFERMGLWRRTSAGLERFSYGQWQLFPTPPQEAVPLEQDVSSIYEDHLRRVWYSVYSAPGTYYCASNGQLTTFTGLPPDSFVTYEDRAGFLWLNGR